MINFTNGNLLKCLCSYCFTEPETVAHLFCDCFIVKNFYFKVVEWMRSYRIYLPSVSENSIVFGYFQEAENWYLISHLINLFKQFVFANRNVESLNLLLFRSFVKNIRLIEYKIAKRKDKLHVLFVKWGKLQPDE